MRIDVIDLIRIDLCIIDRCIHATAGTTSILQRSGHVIGIGAHTETDDFGIDFGAACLGMFIFFKNENTGTLTENKTVTITIPRSGCRCRVIVSG